MSTTKAAAAISKATLDKLARFDTPTICNVIELFDVRPRNTGFMDGRIQCCFPEMKPMVGYATTATFRSNAPPRGADVYCSMDDQLKAFASSPDLKVTMQRAGVIGAPQITFVQGQDWASYE